VEAGVRRSQRRPCPVDPGAKKGVSEEVWKTTRRETAPAFSRHHSGHLSSPARLPGGKFEKRTRPSEGDGGCFPGASGELRPTFSTAGPAGEQTASVGNRSGKRDDPCRRRSALKPDRENRSAASTKTASSFFHARDLTRETPSLRGRKVKLGLAAPGRPERCCMAGKARPGFPRPRRWGRPRPPGVPLGTPWPARERPSIDKPRACHCRESHQRLPGAHGPNQLGKSR